MASAKQQALWNNSASKGGKIRAERLSPEKRADIAKKAAITRWRGSQDNGSNNLIASFPGTLFINDLVLPCAVLDNGVRVLSETGMTKALGSTRGGAHWKRLHENPSRDYLPVFLSANNLEPFVSPSLHAALSNPILYKTKSGAIAYGVLATLVPEICETWLKARKVRGVLNAAQEEIADKAERLLGGLARVGIIALIDAATGYEQYRDRYELNKILQAYVSKQLLPWEQRFPEDYYKELFRLRGWSYSPPQPKRPRIISQLTSELVYQKLPEGVYAELKSRNPIIKDGRRAHKNFQFLTENVGNPHLEKQLTAVITLMKASPNWGTFKRLFNRAFAKEGVQSEMFEGEDL